MKRRPKVSCFLLAMPMFAIGAARAQTPLGNDLVVAAFPTNVQAEYSPEPVCDNTGSCGAFWSANHNDPDSNTTDILAAVLSSHGTALIGPKILATVHFPTRPLVVALEQGFAVLWDSQFPDGHVSPTLRYYDESLTLQKVVTLPFVMGAPGLHNPISYIDVFDIVRTSLGFVLYAVSIDNPSLVYDAFAFFVDQDGKQLHPRQRLNDHPATQSVGLGPNGLAVQANGDLVAVYWRGSAGASDIYLRRFTANGTLLGPEQQVNVDRRQSQGQPVVATAPNSSFMVAWQRSPVPGTTQDILARRFSANGKPLGDPFQVNNVHQLDQRYPVVAADAQGNYFVSWQSYIPGFNWDIKGRLFRNDGAPVADEVRLNQVRQLEQESPQVCFSPEGTVIAGWQSASVRQKGNEEFVPVVRVFSVPAQANRGTAGAGIP
jgi:hypothetical protein